MRLKKNKLFLFSDTAPSKNKQIIIIAASDVKVNDCEYAQDYEINLQGQIQDRWYPF